MTRIFPLLCLMSLALIAGCNKPSDHAGGSLSKEWALFYDSPRGYEDAPGAFRVMTFNLRYDNPGDGENRWELRRNFAADLMHESGASVVGIQEGLHHQVAFLDSALPQFTYVGVGRDDGAQAGEYAAIFVDTTRWEIIDSGTFWLSETPTEPSVGWDASMERIATYVFVLERGGMVAVSGKRDDMESPFTPHEGISSHSADQTPILILNAHFDHMGAIARLESARLIREKIHLLRQFGEDMVLPVVVMGDFNTSPDSETIQVFRTFMNDAFEKTSLPPQGPVTTFTGFKVIENGYMDPDGRIDYVFVSDSFDVHTYLAFDGLRNGRYVSDHFPIVVGINIP